VLFLGPVSIRPLLILCALLLVMVSSGCSCGKDREGGDDRTGAAPSRSELPPLELRDDTPNLLLTWIDEAGDFHVVQKIADVPETGRADVRVVVTTKEEGTGSHVYVADLRKKNPEGSYPVRSTTRAAWDEKGASKRKARLEALVPPAPSAPGSGSAPAPSEQPPAKLDGKIVAIIYGADWCKPCHDAARYLKQRGVTVIEKDVEKSDLVQQEMQTKLKRAGLGGASIPVIDVMGQMLVGFSPRALDRAVEAARNSKPL
jgi:glutaredoxin